MITKYSEYQLERILESLINESKLEFSRPFINILNSMSGNELAKELIKLVTSGSDLKLTQNYIDVSPEKDSVTFIQNSKAEEILGKEEVKWITSDTAGDKYFTFNKNENGEYKNRHLFDALGFEPKLDSEGKPEAWTPSSGVIGRIKAETVSKKSGKVAAWFITDDGREAIINKEALLPHNASYDKLWTTSRNPIKVGRLVKSILNVAGYQTTPKQIEDFVNSYKSAFDIINDAFAKLKLVNGKDIAYWYNSSRYESMESTLGNSCMADVDSDFFDIYVYNSNVCSLLILFSDGGSIQNGQYMSNKIKGRALVWKTDQGDTFMDRIYTNEDSDVALFKQYAESKGWWFKTKQNSDTEFSVSNGKTQKSMVNYTVKLEDADFEKYPYVDTLCYLNLNDSIISNSAAEIDAEYELNSTGGYREEL